MEKRKLKANEVADFFICLGKAEQEDPMTNMRVNKLLYFAQGWYLQRFGKTLFAEPIKAWKYGPVVNSVYGRFRDMDRNIILECSPDFDVSKFSSDEIQLLLDVYSKYRTYSTSRLVEKSHEANTPWARTYVEGENKTIPVSLMKEYFSNRPPLKAASILSDNVKTIGRINPETGRTILPAEEDWEDDIYEDFT